MIGQSPFEFLLPGMHPDKKIEELEEIKELEREKKYEQEQAIEDINISIALAYFGVHPLIAQCKLNDIGQSPCHLFQS